MVLNNNISFEITLGLLLRFIVYTAVFFYTVNMPIYSVNFTPIKFSTQSLAQCCFNFVVGDYE